MSDWLYLRLFGVGLAARGWCELWYRLSELRRRGRTADFAAAGYVVVDKILHAVNRCL